VSLGRAIYRVPFRPLILITLLLITSLVLQIPALNASRPFNNKLAAVFLDELCLMRSFKLLIRKSICIHVLTITRRANKTHAKSIMKIACSLFSDSKYLTFICNVHNPFTRRERLLRKIMKFN
jgi:hypothetical protein